MKRRILICLFLFSSLLSCYSQNNESLGDNAMKSGNYASAVQYYLAANEKNPTVELAEKLSLATLLKNEFEAIDIAIQQRDEEALELHINNVLTADPNNKFIDAKRRQLSNNVSRHRSNSIKSIFIGGEDRQDRFGGISFDAGGGVFTTKIDEGIKFVLNQHLAIKFVKSFPIVIDATSLMCPRGELFGVGGGSCFFIGNHLSLDYGAGWQWSKMTAERERLKGNYYRIGMTYLWDNGFGVSYSYNRYNDHVLPINSHQLSLVLGKGSMDKLPVLSALFLVHALIFSGIEIASVFK